MTDSTHHQIDSSWAAEQLALAGFKSGNADRQSVQVSVLALIDRLNQQRSDHARKKLVVELFSKLANGQPIAPRDVQTNLHRWKPLDRNLATTGATVRVREDAYSGRAADIHNGMVGTIVAARGGEYVVQYASSTDGSGARHPADRLEVLEA